MEVLAWSLELTTWVVENKIEKVVFGSGHLLEGQEEVDGEEHQEKIKGLETAQNPENHSYSRHLC